MKKYMYKAMTSIEDYNLEDIDWKKIVKYSKRHLFTEEFIQKYMKELIDNKFVSERPRLSIRVGVTKAYLESYNVKFLTPDNIRELRDILWHVDKRIFINDVALHDYTIDIIELLKTKFKHLPIFIFTPGIEFLVSDDDVAFLSDKENFRFLEFKKDDTTMGYYEWRKLHTIFKIKYGDEWLPKYGDTLIELHNNHVIPTMNFIALLNRVGMEVDPNLKNGLTDFELERLEFYDKQFKKYCLTL